MLRPGPFHTEPFKIIADVEYATSAEVHWWSNRGLHTTLGALPQPSSSKPTALL